VKKQKASLHRPPNPHSLPASTLLSTNLLVLLYTLHIRVTIEGLNMTLWELDAA
jgi:hypothetical protein